ncbi:MAG TPA: sensor histidine kinase [Candidatus Sulfotelmatobacter sp.]|nr:sensor histidine kinase [Candidatus Sulfotelmatobacter sp.]
MAGTFPTRTLTLFTAVPRQRPWHRYSIAVLTGILAILLRWLLDPVLGHVAFYATIYMAVTFCAIVCGSGPAILTGVVGVLGVFYWFVDPRHSWQVINISEIHNLIGAFLVCAVLIALGHANRKKQLRLNDTIAALTAEARERQRAQQELRQAHDELELRVEERTAELSQALSRLESEITVRKNAEAQLRRLSLGLMTMQDQERRRIARELHDTAGQTLAAMKMSLALIHQVPGQSPGLEALLDDLNALVDEALQEVRTTSYLLHPPLLDEAGIASAARWFVEGFASRSEIQVACDIPEKMERPSRDCELVLFRILQESLTNVHRHSGASAASIRLHRDRDRLCLEISDNGKGISPEKISQLNAATGSGVGIRGMRERVRELSGSLDIRSQSGSTTISVVLPMHSQPHASDSSDSFAVASLRSSDI